MTSKRLAELGFTLLVFALAVVVPLLTVGAASAAEPLSIRVWQLQDYNMEHIKRLIDLAAEQGINRIQLSHQIVMNIEQPLENRDLLNDMITICRWAHDKGIRVDMWTHELSGIPSHLLKDGKANLDDPKLWEFVRSRYETLFSICPDLDGLVLTMHETAMSIYHEDKVSSSIPPEKRVAQLIDSLASVCKPLGKELYVRTFSYEPSELRYIQEGLKQSKSDFVVMTKCVPHDWQPYYPFNPAIGSVGGRPQVVEFDLGHEFTGLSTIPYIAIDYLRRHLDYGISKGISGAMIRVERLKWRAVDTPNQANIDVFSRMLLDPSADPHKLFKDWLGKRYGAQAVPHLYSAFVRTQEIADKGLFVLGFWVTNHSLLPTYEYATGSLRRRTTAKWDPSAKPLEQELFNPTPATIKKIDAEKDKALTLVNKSIADIEKAKPYLKASDYACLSDLFQREKAMVVVWKAAMEVIFGIDAYRSAKSKASAEFLQRAASRLEKVAKENKSHLIKMAADSQPNRTDNFDRAMGLVQAAHKALQTQ